MAADWSAVANVFAGLHQLLGQSRHPISLPGDMARGICQSLPQRPVIVDSPG
jgi:hypothetical protein